MENKRQAFETHTAPLGAYGVMLWPICPWWSESTPLSSPLVPRLHVRPAHFISLEHHCDQSRPLIPHLPVQRHASPRGPPLIPHGRQRIHVRKQLYELRIVCMVWSYARQSAHGFQLTHTFTCNTTNIRFPNVFQVVLCFSLFLCSAMFL